VRGIFLHSGQGRALADRPTEIEEATVYTIAWEANPVSESVTGYRVSVNGQAVGETAGLAIEVGVAAPGTYVASVCAVNAGGMGPAGQATHVEPEKKPPPSQVQGVRWEAATQPGTSR
jgi:hypothetical protein